MRDLPDDDLAMLYTRAVADSDDTLADQVLAELDRRDEADGNDGWDMLEPLSSSKPRSQREQAKEAYLDWVHAQYVRAVEATGGNLLNRAGRAAGFDEMSMLNGGASRPQVKKYASEELLQWFATAGNERMTETEFVNLWMGNETTAQRDRRRSPLSEF